MIRKTTGAIALALGMTFGVQAQEVGDEAFGERVREYLLANPELLIEMQQALETRQTEMARAAQAEALSADRDRIFASERDVVLGNPDGDVTIVEFFDYNCGFCRRAMDDMKAVIAADSNVRFVLKEFPILGPASLDAHVVSMAVAEVAPESYDTFHERLLGAGGRADGDSALALAVELGIEEEKLLAFAADSSAQDAFADTYELANALQITGTPSYVVGDEVLFGAQGADALLERVDRLRTVDDAAN